MSESETRALIERYFAAVNAADGQTVLDLLDEDVVHDPALGPRAVGADAFRRFLATAARHYREEMSDIAIMLGEGGTRAAAEFTLRGTYLSTADGLPEAAGQAYSVPAGTFFEIEDGRIARLTSYRDLDDWIAQLSRT